jgi:hypothetical protein
MPTSMAITRLSASRFFSIAAFQSIAASFQGGGIIARVEKGVDRNYFFGLTGERTHPQGRDNGPEW